MNKRRDSYDVEQRSTLTPVIITAVIAAFVMHAMMYFSLPYLVAWKVIDLPNRVDPIEEIIRIVATEREVEEHIPDEEEVQEKETPDEIVVTEEEIDLIDMEFEELVMAPGETELAVAEPEVEESVPAPETMPLGDAALDLPLTPLPAVEESYVEPAPVNNNDIVANLPSADLGDMDESIKAELKSKVGQSDGLPDDNRSLEQLMKIRNPGAASGVARLGTDVLFTFGKAQLLNASRVTMIQLAALISKNPSTQFVIEGHTDGIGRKDYNDVLSLQRAASVREWLKSNGIPTQNVYLRACGSRRPLVPVTGTADEQKLNRRVEIHMRKQGEELPSNCLGDQVKIDITKSPSQYVRERLLERNDLKQ
ncbi:MAG: OmpA family protein [Akkermansia sp.]